MNSATVFREIATLPIDLDDDRTWVLLNLIKGGGVLPWYVERLIQHYLNSFPSILQVVKGALKESDYFFWVTKEIDEYDIRTLIARALDEDYRKEEFQDYIKELREGLRDE